KLADIRKEERTGEKDCRLQEQAAAEDEFRGGGGQSANGTLIRDAFCTAIQATSHELQYTALGCRREFREQILEMLLALLFGKRDGDAHAEAGLYALHRTIQPHRPLHAESRAEIRAHPKHIFRFDEHSPGANVSRASFQPRGTPFDLEMSLIAKTRGPAAVQPARP